MKFLVIGCGSIGKRHISNLKALSAGDIIANDVRVDRCAEVEEAYGIKTYIDIEEALGQKPDAVFIASPTSLHLQQALAASERGCNLFIEKPLSHTLDGVDELIEVVTQKKLVTLVSCNMRFHASLSLVKELLDRGSLGKVISARLQAGFYLSDWHPYEDYRKGYSANKSLGGGVILDGIHEIDYLRWFLGEVRQVFCFAGKLGELEIDVEDTAEILLKFETGAIAEVHLDYIQRTRGRSCQLIGDKGTVIWDQNEAAVKFYSAEDAYWRVYPEPFDYSINEMYIKQIEHFLRCIGGEEHSIQDVREAKSILRVALAAKESAQSGNIISLQPRGKGL
jgi:predicted dehydrogenase